MKWNNPGKELTDQIESFKDTSPIYIYGAGAYGMRIKMILDFLGLEYIFVDRNAAEPCVQERICGSKIITPDELFAQQGAGPRIAVAVNPDYFPEIAKILDEHGFARGIDYWDDLTFRVEILPVLYFARCGKIYSNSICRVSTTICNINCQGCLNFTAYNRHMTNSDINDIIKDVDLFFARVDKVNEFSYTGGEPFLHPDLDKGLEHILSKWRDKIVDFSIPTTCTIVPKDSTCQIMAKYNVRVVLDNYPVKNHLDEIIEKFDRFGVCYTINQLVDACFIDLAADVTDNSHLTEEELVAYASRCNVEYRCLRDGRLCACNYADFAVSAGFEASEDDYFDLSAGNDEELLEFIVGYSKRGYTNLCTRCAGYHKINPYKIPAGRQLTREEVKEKHRWMEATFDTP